MNTSFTQRILPVVLLFIAIAAVQVYLCLQFEDVRLLVDEGTHLDQIKLFVDGKWELAPTLTTIPGYHFVQAMISKVTGGIHGNQYYRFVNLGFAFLCIFVFYLNTKGMAERTRLWYTAIFSTFPLYYPFFQLIYTDTLALLMILLLYYFQKRSNYIVAGLFLIMACLIRQNNIVWGLYFVVLAIYEQYQAGNSYKKIALSLSSYALCFVLFVVFYKVNGGVAIGDKWAHPSMEFRSENVYYFLFMFSALCAPYVIEEWMKVKTLNLTRGIILLLLAGTAIALYWLTYKGDHFYNQGWPEIFIRNGFIKYFKQDTNHEWAFLILAILALVALYNFSANNFQRILLLLVTILGLMPSWMIEVRYYFIPFALFLLTPKAESRITLSAQLIINLVLLYYLSTKVPADLLFP